MSGDKKKQPQTKRRLPAERTVTPGGTTRIEASRVSAGGTVHATDCLEATPNGSFRNAEGELVRDAWHRKVDDGADAATIEAARQLDLQSNRDARKKRKKNTTAAARTENNAMKSDETKAEERRGKDKVRKQANRDATMVDEERDGAAREKDRERKRHERAATDPTPFKVS
jgi:hypothetical protein